MNSDLQKSVEQFLYRKAELCDRQQWVDYLELFDENSEFHIPQWDSEHVCTSDPKKGMSLMYYPNRAGLEDRVVRIRSGKSPASTPMPRTAHVLGSVLALDSPAERLRLGSTWVTHVYFPRSRESHAFFGRSEHELALRGGEWRIAKKKILLQNDYIPTMLDVYCV